MTTPSESGAVAKVSVELDKQGFAVRNASQLWEVAGFIAKSKLKPAGLETQADCFLLMAYGQMYGYSEMEALQRLHVVKGKVCIGATDMVAKIQAHPLCREYRTWSEGEGDARAGCVQSWRKGQPERNAVVRFTLADAKRAGLYDEKWRDRNGEPSVWVKYPDDQLIWKAAARDYRRNWPDAYRYKLTPLEDLRELEQEREERDVTPARAAAPPPASPALQALAAGAQPLEPRRSAEQQRNIDRIHERMARIPEVPAAEPAQMTLDVEPVPQPPAARSNNAVTDSAPPPVVGPPAATEPPAPFEGELSAGLRDAIRRRLEAILPQHRERAGAELERMVRERLGAGEPYVQGMAAIRAWQPRFGG